MLISDSGKVVVVTVVSDQCLTLWRTCEPYLALGRRAFVLDLSQVEFLNSVNVAAILIARNRLSVGGSELLIAGLTPRLLEVFRALRLERLFDVSLTREAALQLFAGKL